MDIFRLNKLYIDVLLLCKNLLNLVGSFYTKILFISAYTVYNRPGLQFNPILRLLIDTNFLNYE